MNLQSKNKFPLRGLYFYITDSCNLKCQHCWISSKYKKSKSNKELNFDLFCKIIEEAKPLGLNFVRLTGGEPLLHSQIGKIINHVEENDLVLDIESNGTLITSEFAKMLGKIKKKNIAISLDGVNAETHDFFRGVKGSFKKTIGGILNLTNAGINPELIICVSKTNKSQIQDMIKFAEDLHLRSLNFKIIAPIGRGEEIFSKDVNLAIKELIKLGEWFENELIPRSKIPVTFGHPPVFKKMSALFGSQKVSCNICGIKNILGVLSDGEYALCGIGTMEKELCFGNAKIYDLASIWLNNSVINEIRDGLPDKLKGVCAICAMKKVCIGSCIAQNFYLKKDLWSPFWYCDEAYKLNMFPKTRILETKNSFKKV